MGERSQPQIEGSAEQKRGAITTGLDIAAGVSSIAGGAAVGAYVANELFPPTIELAPGLAAQASIASGEGLIVPTGPAAELYFPTVPTNTLGPWHAVKLDVNNIHNIRIPKHNPDWFNNYVVGIFSQPKSNITEPIRDALIERLAIGAGIGALTVAAIGGAACALVRMRRKNAKLATENASLKRLHEESPTENPVAPERPQKRWRRLRRPLAALALTATLATTGVLLYKKAEATNGSTLKGSVALPSKITTLNKFLKGGRIKGPLRGLPHTVVDGISEIKKDTDEALALSAQNFKQKYTAFLRSSRQYRNLRANPNIRSLLHISDLHCNFAYADKVFGSIIQDIQPDLVMNTGDTQTNSNTIPYEKNCFPAFLDQLDNIPMVNVNGNHDEKTPVKGTITLSKGNDYHATVQGIDFVGDNDPEDTEWSATRESGKDGLDKESVKRGKRIADIACKIMEETGIKPIALAHRWQMLAEPIMRGCIVIANSGHLHRESKVQRYTAADGITSVLSHNAGSATGVRGNIPIYSNYAGNGFIMEQLYDITTHTFRGFITYTFRPDSSVKITFIKASRISDQATYPRKMINYLTKQHRSVQQSASINTP